jgi:hypothetical protein
VAYAFTTRHALAVQTRPELRCRTVPLATSEVTLRAGADLDVRDLWLTPRDGSPPLVFSDLADCEDLHELVPKLKSAPDVMEQQIALVAEWAALHQRFS